MGCCGSGNTTAPPFRYSPTQPPLPKEKPSKSAFRKYAFPKSQGYVHTVSCSTDSLFACNWNSTLTIYDGNEGRVVEEFQPHAQNISQCRFFNGGNEIMTSSYDRTLKLWSTSNLAAPKKTFQGHGMAVASFCIAEEGKKLCSGSRDQSVALWDISTGERVAEKTIPRNTVTCVELVPTQQNSFVQCSEDLSIRIWDTRELKPVTMIPLNDNYFACSCSVDSSGTKLLTGHYASNEIGCGVILWDLRKFSEDEYLWRYLEHKESVVQVKIHSRDSSELAISASKDGRMKAIRMADGLEVDGYQDEAKWPFTTFGIADKGSLAVAALCKNGVSKLLALKVGAKGELELVGSTSDEEVTTK